jgi:hypothetical protein
MLANDENLVDLHQRLFVFMSGCCSPAAIFLPHPIFAHSHPTASLRESSKITFECPATCYNHLAGWLSISKS